MEKDLIKTWDCLIPQKKLLIAINNLKNYILKI